MKNILAAALVIATGMSATAQTQVTTVNDADKHQVVTNKFKSNWFINIGAGGLVSFGDHNKQGSIGDLITPNFGISGGKWFSPGIGAQIGVNGLQMRGLTQNGAHSTGELFDQSQNLYHSKQNFVQYHADVLFNVTNMISGYKEDRLYNVIPYAGIGYFTSSDRPTADEIAANIGVKNQFRLSNKFALNLDVRATAVHDRADGEEGARNHEGMLSAQVGVTYRFKKRNWEKPTVKETVITKYDEVVANQLREENNALKALNDQLRKELTEKGGNAVKQLIASPVLVTFPIDESTVSNEARVNLGFFAKNLKEASSETVYQITGYADKGTGSVERNRVLSIERAQAIYDVLTKEFGVNPAQLEMKAMGGVDNMYYNDPAVSRAVITIAK